MPWTASHRRERASGEESDGAAGPGSADPLFARARDCWWQTVHVDTGSRTTGLHFVEGKTPFEIIVELIADVSLDAPSCDISGGARECPCKPGRSDFSRVLSRPVWKGFPRMQLSCVPGAVDGVRRPESCVARGADSAVRDDTSKSGEHDAKRADYFFGFFFPL